MLAETADFQGWGDTFISAACEYLFCSSQGLLEKGKVKEKAPWEYAVVTGKCGVLFFFLFFSPSLPGIYFIEDQI